MKKIGMVVALEDELIPLLESVNVKIKKKKNGAYTVSTFKLGKNRVVCVNGGVGEISASAATQYLISEYAPDAIINFGVCGSLIGGLGLKSVVLLNGVVHYDFDTSAIDDVEPGRYFNYPSAIIKTDGALLQRAQDVSPSIQSVVCASGDKFIADEEVKRKLAETYGASVCEMESAGVLLTANKNGVPCLMVKAVSDADGGANDYATTMHEAAKEYIDFLVKFTTFY